MDLRRWITAAVDEIERWQDEFGAFEPHPSVHVPDADFGTAFAEFTDRLRDNYPFFHPRYAGQMLKPPHPAAVVGQLAAMLINPNNHALDGGPATARMEREAVARLAAMFGFPQHLGHLTTSGTTANLEALYVARETRPGAVAHSEQAHFTHSRMCHLLGVPSFSVPTGDTGRMDVEALESLLRTENIGTVVLTLGTTNLGAVDPVDEVLELRARYGFRIHVDAAYGGFFSLIADDEPDGVRSAPFRAVASCDSVVVDPHKHGLQPYGCGAVLFADPEVHRLYEHSSPSTYFTAGGPGGGHLGEISLECSRAGASAAGLWLTFRLLPPTADGLGEVLRPIRRAALRWADLLADSRLLSPYQRPELDIVTCFPRARRLSDIDAVSAAVLESGMADPPEDALYLALSTVDAEALVARGHDVTADAAQARILRSVLMKPESEHWVDQLHSGIENLVDRVRSGRNDSEP